MLHSVISSLLPQIQNLSFADKVGGIVYPLQKKIKGKDDVFYTKTFPVYGNDPSVCESGTYIEMVMDDRLKSVIYFEGGQESTINGTGCGEFIHVQASLTLVAWFNLSKIDKNLKSGESMLRVIAGAINGSYDIGTTHAVLSIQNINFRDPAIFSKWSYIEADKQFLIYPRDFGAVTYNVQLSYPLCDEDPEIDPSC